MVNLKLEKKSKGSLYPMTASSPTKVPTKTDSGTVQVPPSFLFKASSCPRGLCWIGAHGLGSPKKGSEVFDFSLSCFPC